MDATRNYSNNPLHPLDSGDPMFKICWGRQSCSHCLSGDVGCSWCAIVSSSTCVPNPSRLSILSPLRSSQICPLGAKERWELRASPTGCNVSTLTVLACVGAVLGTLAIIILVFAAVWIVRVLRQRWKRLKYENVESDQEQTFYSRTLGLIFGQRQDQNPASVDEEFQGEHRPLLE
ncbi:hypothetical protein N7495_002728 [Penicillium taxi]|uniref:uncharacterized protein n=1 Tax=Penicillium taxi TaxID=168475 RepID=UPI0025457781|nr:uncharacterized protein N7495_002728 [Penicillium taxi]KAJ5902200.1 hypothetical protein N7495_002728 [Penicillium taxi]